KSRRGPHLAGPVVRKNLGLIFVAPHAVLDASPLCRGDKLKARAGIKTMRDMVSRVLMYCREGELVGEGISPRGRGPPGGMFLQPPPLLTRLPDRCIQPPEVSVLSAGRWPCRTQNISRNGQQSSFLLCSNRAGEKHYQGTCNRRQVRGIESWRLHRWTCAL